MAETFGMYIPCHIHRLLTIETKDYVGIFDNRIPLLSIAVPAAAPITWLYHRAFKERDWNKRDEIQEKR
jgi:hypothetical protein